MALTLLPEEVLELIVKYFTVKDLIACSSVSLEWREKFNNDLFWKMFCFKAVKDYLEETNCEVDAGFQQIQSTEDRLQLICDWRLHYMRRTHLINNWKSGRFSSTPVRDFESVHFVELKVDSDGSHWLFLRTSFNIEVWNVSSTPKLVTTLPMFPDCLNTSVLVARGRVVVCQWNSITVYSIEHQLDVLLRCTIEEDEILDTTIWKSTTKSDITTLNEVDDFKFTTFGNLLVAHKRIPSPPSDTSMHIWDLSTKKKLKRESILNNHNDFIEIVFSNIFKMDETQGIIRILSLSLEYQLCSFLYVYDFKRLEFKETKIECTGVVVWCGSAHNIIIAFTGDPGTIEFFDFTTGNLLSIKEIGIYTNSEQMQIMDSYLLYCMFNCMNVLNIHNQEVVYCLEFSFYSFVRKLTVIEPRFVVVWLLERSGSPGCPSYYQEVWDLKDLSRKLLQFSSELGYEMVTNSPSLVKQVACYNGVIHICTFW